MSRIDDLIAEHCHDGVKYLHLQDVASIRNGKDYKALGSGDVPVYGSGGVMTHVDTAAFSGPSVLIPRKGSLGNLFFVDGPFWTVDTIFYTEIKREIIEPRFLFYYLSTMRLGEMNQAGGVPSQTQSVLNRLRIPVPPLAVQREIAGILEQMEALQAELQAELQARQQQYAHYRKAALDFRPDDSVRWRPLGDVATVGTGSHDTKDAIPDGKYVFYARGREPLRLDAYDFDERAIITAGDGAGVGKVFHFASGRYALHQRAYRVVPGEELEARYLYHYFVTHFSKYLEQTSVQASVTSLRRPMFLKFPVPVPPLPEQVRIVSMLDSFDALSTDLSIGLPAEIEARRKQYEYYRDRLLTFRELVA